MLQTLTRFLPKIAIPDLLPEGVDANEVKLAVQSYSQSDSYSCGAVAAYSVVCTFRAHVSYRAVLAASRPDPKWGMSARKVANALRQFRIGVAERDNLTWAQVRRTIDEGFPMILSIHTPGSSDGHWVVLYGYGVRPNRIFLSGRVRPGFSRQTLTWPEFSAIWKPKGNGLICWGK